MRRRTRYLAVAAAAGVIGATIAAIVTTDKSSADDRSIRLVGKPVSLPDGCGVAFVARAVDDAMTALSAGDEDRLDEVFSILKGFRFSIVYSVGDRVVRRHLAGLNSTSYRSELIAHVRRRQAAGESIRLLALKVAPVFEFRRQLVRERVDFEIVLDRQADDLASVLGGAPGLTHGKGVFDCRAGKVAVLAVGTRVRSVDDPWSGGTRFPWPCPIPRDWERGRQVVACAASPRR